jgi:recombination protein RecA
MATATASASASAVETVETLLRAKKLDVTLTSARPWSRDEREARLAPTGWLSVDAALGGGFPRGECSEIAGAASSGRTSMLCALMAAAAARGEVMALVDTLDCFDPVSAAAMGVDLSRLLWVRGTMLPSSGASQSSSSSHLRGRAREGAAPASGIKASASSAAMRSRANAGANADERASGAGRRSAVDRHGVEHEGHRLGRASGRAAPDDLLARMLDRAIKSFGLVLQSGGFGVVALDLGDVPMRAVKRLPFTTWLRAQRLIEGRDTVGVVIAREPIARSARGVTVRLTGDGSSAPTWSGAGDRGRLFTGFTLRPQVASAHRLGRDGPLR